MEFNQVPEADMVVNDVINRFHVKKLGTTIYIIGLSGTGKSSSSIRIAELIKDKRKEKPEIYIVDSLLEFLDVLIRCKQGEIIIIEEVSVLFPSRRAMSTDNLAISKVLDTCRKKRLCLISNAPIWGSIDSHMRAMGNVLIETLKINRKEGIVISKFHRLQTNPGSGKTYRHTYVRNGRDVSRMYTKMPNIETWESYEKKKDEFMLKLYTDLKEKQIKKDKKEKIDSQPVRRKALTPRQEKVMRVLANIKESNRYEVASKKLGVCMGAISRTRKYSEKKGYTLEEFKENIEKY